MFVDAMDIACFFAFLIPRPLVLFFLLHCSKLSDPERDRRALLQALLIVDHLLRHEPEDSIHFDLSMLQFQPDTVAMHFHIPPPSTSISPSCALYCP